MDELLKVPDLQPGGGLTREQAETRVGLLKDVEDQFVNQHPGLTTGSHRAAYERAVKLMKTRSREGVRTRKTNRRSCATPTAATCLARGACWRAGWSNAACHLSKSRSAQRRVHRRRGTRTKGTSTR